MSGETKASANGRAAFYALTMGALIAVARAHGYALAVHGSCARDFDLVAVPWTEEATDALTLVRALKDATGAVTNTADSDELLPDCNPHERPHGRVAYSLHFTDHGGAFAYIDLSVMPRAPHKEVQP